MQTYGRRIQIGVTLAAGILLMATELKPQMPSVGPVWEYTSVTGSAQVMYDVGTAPQTRATICYANANGCRTEQVNSSTGDSNRGTEAVMAAAAKLGEKGWELTATNELSSGYRIMYFKRLKSVLNRSDSPGAR